MNNYHFKKLRPPIAGFTDIDTADKENSEEIIRGWNFGEGVEKMVFPAYIKAVKPAI
jgi:hypothetical protein